MCEKERPCRPPPPLSPSRLCLLAWRFALGRQLGPRDLQPCCLTADYFVRGLAVGMSNVFGGSCDAPSLSLVVARLISQLCDIHRRR